MENYSTNNEIDSRVLSFMQQERVNWSCGWDIIVNGIGTSKYKISAKLTPDLKDSELKDEKIYDLLPFTYDQVNESMERLESEGKLFGVRLPYSGKLHIDISKKEFISNDEEVIGSNGNSKLRSMTRVERLALTKEERRKLM